MKKKKIIKQEERNVNFFCVAFRQTELPEQKLLSFITPRIREILLLLEPMRGGGTEIFMLGIIFAIIAGSAMSIQGVMNTRLSEKIGLYESNMFVQGTAFLLSVLAVWILGKGNLKEIANVNKWYLLGGLLGIVITITVMLAIGKLSPTVAISIILISQLLTAALIDAFGIMESQKCAFLWNKYIGLALMICGMVLFKWQIKQ